MQKDSWLQSNCQRMRQYYRPLLTVFSVVLVLVLASSCKSQYELLLNSNDNDLKYEKAFEYFNNEKYRRAAELFESLSQVSGGTDRDDTIKFYWGYSNYLYGDYVTAEANLKYFTDIYPLSPFTEYAKYLRIICLYKATYRYELDQVPTYQAMDAIGRFLIENPGSEHADECYAMLDDLNARLDKKAFEAARLYYIMEDYKASRTAFRNILKEDAETIYREDILYYTAMSSYEYALNSVREKQRERYLTFIDDYYNFVSEYPGSDYRKQLDNCYSKVQRYLGRHSGTKE